MGFASDRELPWPLKLALSLDRQECSYVSAISQWVGGPLLKIVCAAARLGSAPLQATMVGLSCVSAGGLTRESCWWAGKMLPQPFPGSSPFPFVSRTLGFVFRTVEMVCGGGSLAQPWVID